MKKNLIVLGLLVITSSAAVAQLYNQYTENEGTNLPILVEGREWVTKFTYLDRTYSTSTTPVIYSIDGDTVLNDGMIGKKLIWKNGPILHRTDYALVEYNGRLELIDKNGTSTLQMDLSAESEKEFISRGFKSDFCELDGNSYRRLYDDGDPRLPYIDWSTHTLTSTGGFAILTFPIPTFRRNSLLG